MARKSMFDESEKPAKYRTINDTKAEKEAQFAHIRSLGGSSNRLTLAWDLNEKSIEEGVCLIEIGDESAYVSVEQLNRYLRWV